MDELSPLRRAKRPRTILAGPYGHPLHALLITIPIGAWTASLIFDLVAIFGDDTEAFAQGARWLVGIGVLGGLLAAVFGLLDYSVIERGTKARKIALIHMVFNIGAIILFTISFFVRLGVGDEFSTVAFVMSILGIACIGVSGFLGGELAYRYGVRVADESTQQEAFTTTADTRR